MLESKTVRFPGWLLVPILAGCATPNTPLPHAAPVGDLCARFECAPHDNSGVTVEDGKLVANGKVLTQQFAAIQSFDVSRDRGEVVFSAKRAGNFDIGLVSLEGSDIHWVPEDPADETDVQWAPRGNKVSYIVHARAGDVVRTVHVPTAVQLSVDFPYAAVRALAWNRAAERYWVVVSSPDASERIESMQYSGEVKRTEAPPEVKLDVAEEPLAGALLLRPPAMRYGEKLPLVVWVSDPPFVWNDARGALMRNRRVACAIMRRAPDAAFWAAATAIPWIDTGRIYVIGATAAESRGAPPQTKYLKDSNGVR
jgi:hypothetical protein